MTAISINPNLQKTKSNKSKITGVTTGYAKLDAITSGFQKSDLIFIAFQDYRLKTNFLNNISAFNFSKKNNLSVPVIPINFNKSSAENINYLKKMLIEFDVRNKHNVLIVKNARPSETDSLNNTGIEDDIKIIVNFLKETAIKLNIPILVFLLINEIKDYKNLKLSEFPYYKIIEPFADLIMFIYYDAVYNSKVSENKKIAKINICNPRNGSLGTVKIKPVSYQKKLMRILNLN